jgi:hypothetical protein
MARLFVALALTLALASPAAADAPRGPEKVFAGKIILSTKRFPTYAKSPSAYVSAIRKQSATKFHEDKATGEWNIYFAAFLKPALNDLEYTVKLYDLTDGRTMLMSFEGFTDVRGQRTIISKLKLDKKQVGVNKDVLIDIEYRGKRLATGRFRILGEGERYSGKVDFSEDDTKGNGSDDEE